eukprot:TRINITY_DN21200_c0_g1_i1.p1 TRINITY_DN21200_c0_g1~~TRINITY_DN21200_c0_g1_i1.p1  ORF type:complete len:445 (+),score=115.38 TRINITY_DN21200_c0_g1_i1:200-1336(+)
MGNLGNKMMNYVTGRLMRVLYGVDAYVTRSTVAHLGMYFENVTEVPVAEEQLCGFEKFFKEFRTKQLGRIRSIASKELEERNNETEDIFAREKSKGLVSVLHSNKLYNLEVGLDDKTKQLSSFPWKEFSKDAEELLKNEEQKGKAYIFYPSGLLFSAFDKRINETFPMDEVPGMIDFMIRSFKFKEYFREKSQSILQQISQNFKKNNKKLFKKEKEVTFVGIHNRRTDHLDFQKEGGFIPLEAGYFIEAMEMFRAKYPRTVFVYVSDDIKWGREKLKKRVKSKDFYIAGSLQNQELAANPMLAAGLDLAVLSACNHTITSYGTYSFWAGFLAGGGEGKRIIPPFFLKYRMKGQDSRQFNVHPFKSKMPRFYFGLENYR